jgi:hypothetical protein
MTPRIGAIAVGLALWVLLAWYTWQVYFLNRLD